MASEVYANGMEVSGKASPHQVIASMPDVCLSPPSPPAGPVPIPYPNFAQASDTADGSKTVLIGGKEVSLKGKSNYKKSTGDEAATKTLGMGVVSHNITGSVKHEAGSFDVKIEGSGAVRHLDLTTGNHINAGNVGPNPAVSKPKPSGDPDCVKLAKANESVRETLSESEDLDVKGSDGDGCGTTVSSVKVRRTIRSAHNNQKAVAFAPKGTLADGGPPAVREGKKTPLCKGSRYKHPRGKGPGKGRKSKKPYNPGNIAKQKSGHAEARLMQKVSSAPPGSRITLNIDWKPGVGGASKMPCMQCYKMLCAAQKDCEHKISLCKEDEETRETEKVPLNCPGKPPDSAKKSYEDLKESMGEAVID